jgi:flagellum-specific peptidoglycan hydrolase FlgJ
LTAQQLQFLLRVAPPALEGQRAYQIPACVTMAQAILESATPKFGWGSSVLFRLANNPFGIKYCHWESGGREIGRSGEQGKNDRPIAGSSDHPIPQAYGAFEAPTWEIANGQKQAVMAQFERFPNLDEAFRAHARLLRGPRYRPAFAVRDDWKQFAERLGPKTSPRDTEHCGYSTNPSYSAELITLVSRYRLNDPRALAWYAAGMDPGVRAIELEVGRRQ